jgi:hypothetical protein
MKRDQRALLDGRTADEVDGRKRRRTEVEEGGDARLARAQEASRARQQKMKQCLDKWSTLNAEVATEFEITAPAPNPLGTTLRPRVRAILTPPSSSPASPLTPPSQGATTNPTFISRNPSRFECFRAFLPFEAMEQIAQAVTNSLQHRPVGPSEKVKRHYRPASVRDIWAWVAQRLLLSLEKRRTLRDHFNSVWLQT